MSHGVDEGLVIPCGFESFVAEGDFLRVVSEDVEGQTSEGGEVGWSVILAGAGGVFSHEDVELPVELVFDEPMLLDGFEEDFRRHFSGHDEGADIESCFAVDDALRFYAGEGAQ